jgi:hypothetical protein
LSDVEITIVSSARPSRSIASSTMPTAVSRSSLIAATAVRRSSPPESFAYLAFVAARALPGAWIAFQESCT